MEKSSVQWPVVNMRAAPDGASKVVSQGLYGEEVSVRDQTGDWVEIATPDGYLGWVERRSLCPLAKRAALQIELARASAHVYGAPDIEYGPLLTLPYGVRLEKVQEVDVRWIEVRLLDGQRAYVQRGDIVQEPFEWRAFTQKFLGLPYTWGGRSSFGFDCSGFVQTVYRKQGICLPRDARQQIAAPSEAVELENLEAGDLIFWGKGETDIRHVGIYLSDGDFIHTSSRENRPYLRISHLSDEEWRGDLGSYTPYRAARRYAFKAMAASLA